MITTPEYLASAGYYGSQPADTDDTDDTDDDYELKDHEVRFPEKLIKAATLMIDSIDHSSSTPSKGAAIDNSADGNYDGISKYSEEYEEENDEFVFNDKLLIGSLKYLQSLPHYYITMGGAALAKQIMRIGRIHENDPDVQLRCLKLYSIASQKNANIRKLVQIGVGSVAIDCLNRFRDNDSIQVVGSGLISALAFDNDNEIELFKLGASDALVYAVTHYNEEKIQLAFCKGIQNLSTCREHQRYLMEIGCGKLIMDIIVNNMENASILKSACGALGNIAINEENSMKLASLGAGKIIESSMIAHPRFEENVWFGCYCLRNLFVVKSNIPLLQDIDLEPLFDNAMRLFAEANNYIYEERYTVRMLVNETNKALGNPEWKLEKEPQ